MGCEWRQAKLAATSPDPPDCGEQEMWLLYSVSDTNWTTEHKPLLPVVSHPSRVNQSNAI